MGSTTCTLPQDLWGALRKDFQASCFAFPFRDLYLSVERRLSASCLTTGADITRRAHIHPPDPEQACFILFPGHVSRRLGGHIRARIKNEAYRPSGKYRMKSAS